MPEAVSVLLIPRGAAAAHPGHGIIVSQREIIDVDIASKEIITYHQGPYCRIVMLVPFAYGVLGIDDELDIQEIGLVEHGIDRNIDKSGVTVDIARRQLHEKAIGQHAINMEIDPHRIECVGRIIAYASVNHDFFPNRG